MKSPATRRDFLGQLAAAGAGLAAAPQLAAATDPTASARPIIVFSKAFQDLGYDQTAELVAEVGWQGIECPVRKGGQVLPERVEDDLPRMVGSLRRRGLELHIMATDVRDVTDPNTEKVLRVASRLGLRLYRLGKMDYEPDRPLPEQLADIRAKLRDVAALNRELGMCAGFQNHSGGNSVGAPVWDIHEVIEPLDPTTMAHFFDIGHATVEGGYAWPLHARLAAPRLRAVYVKDFTWQRKGDRWEAVWCPLGQGMIRPAFFQALATTDFKGPISQHYEYPLPSGKEMIPVLKKDLVTLRGWLG
jgi:sugar phosphate isomerase/epimerase